MYILMALASLVDLDPFSRIWTFLGFWSNSVKIHYQRIFEALKYQQKLADTYPNPLPDQEPRFKDPDPESLIIKGSRSGIHNTGSRAITYKGLL